MNTSHILVVDDDPAFRQMLADYLTDYDLRVTTLASGRAIAETMAREPVDLIVLDLRLTHGEDGMEITRKLREHSDIPIIMLTARQDEGDRMRGLEVGADDYLTKPCSLRELLARIRTVLRRHRWVRQGCPRAVRAYRFDGWELNLSTRCLTTRDGRQLLLSDTEFNLLAALLEASERVVTRDELLDLSYSRNDEVFNRSVDVQIMRLRRKIESDPAQPRYIRTKRGAGYLFGLPVQTIY